MTYFQDHYEQVRYPIADGDRPGLRRGQLGAIHAIASHFTLRQDPAVIVMPTGSGKTGVLMLTPYLLQAHRALVITPSRLVRNQIATNFRNLKILRSSRVFADTIPGPTVHEVVSKVATPDAWAYLEGFDVVVGIPSSISPAIEGVALPPTDLFDTVLIDEAHHSPARTWNEVLEAFPVARRVLFTATPFRSDRLEIKGHFAYTYPVADAFNDGVFGQINYIPVTNRLASGLINDMSIATEAERMVQEDRAAGFKHFLMVRTDTKRRAAELAEVYQMNTNLKLRVIHSGYSYRTIQATIKQLEHQELDGIICVNMLGEGFDFPNLKIAAVHAPHKSLAITLQFIGRFARTNAPDIGAAKFLAIPSEITIEAERLYDEGAIWQSIVPGLLDEQVQKELKARQVLTTFIEEESGVEDADLNDVSLYSLRPYYHAKIYRVTDEVVIDREIELPPALTVVRRHVSKELSTAVIITKEPIKPRWTHSASFNSMEYNLFVIYYNAEAKLLFINASKKSDVLYEYIARQYAGNRVQQLSLDKINKAYSGLRDPEFYNIGLRNRLSTSNTETYRIIAGGNAQESIRKSDGRLYQQGHTFSGAMDSDQGDLKVTIGLSSSSKIWSNMSSRLPDFLDWCERLAQKLASDAPTTTHSKLDYLGISETVANIPQNVIAASWNSSAYLNPPRVSYRHSDGRGIECQLPDLDLTVDPQTSNSQVIQLSVRGDGLDYPLEFSLTEERYFTSLCDAKLVMIERHNLAAGVSLLDYINARPIEFYFADFSHLIGRSLLRAKLDDLKLYEEAQIEVVAWDAEGVETRTEYGDVASGRLSIHDYLMARLLREGHDFIYYDHGSGEIADYLTAKVQAEGVHFQLYHCKGSKGKKIGNRVGDLYEVCGQVSKSLKWIHKNQRLLVNVRRRGSAKPERFVRGDYALFEKIVEEAKRKGSLYEIWVVQPGISRSNYSPELAHLLASADDYVVRGGCQPLRVLGSA